MNRSAFGTGVPLKTESSNTSHAILATEEYRISLSVGTDANGSALVGASIAAVGSSGAGAAVWSTADLTSTSARLRWPDPMQGQAYAIKDFPRFYTPPWGPTPIPAKASVEPALLPTNGYDFRGNVDGDVYIFLGLQSMDGWAAGRREFLTLAGPTPVLPDWAFGVWFTDWNPCEDTRRTSNPLRACKCHLAPQAP